MSQKSEEIFQRLNKLLTNAPILNIVDLEKDFVLWKDACIEGLGGVLIQEGYAIHHESRKLKEHEKKNETRDLEITSIIHVVGLRICTQFFQSLYPFSLTLFTILPSSHPFCPIHWHIGHPSGIKIYLARFSFCLLFT